MPPPPTNRAATSGIYSPDDAAGGPAYRTRSSSASATTNRPAHGAPTANRDVANGAISPTASSIDPAEVTSGHHL